MWNLIIRGHATTEMEQLLLSTLWLVSLAPIQFWRKRSQDRRLRRNLPSSRTSWEVVENTLQLLYKTVHQYSPTLPFVVAACVSEPMALFTAKSRGPPPESTCPPLPPPSTGDTEEPVSYWVETNEEWSTSTALQDRSVSLEATTCMRHPHWHWTCANFQALFKEQGAAAKEQKATGEDGNKLSSPSHQELEKTDGGVTWGPPPV